MKRKIIYLFLLLGLFACEKEEITIDPVIVSIEGKWQLDEIYHDDALYTSGDQVKDRHTMEFMNDQIYKKTFFKDGTGYEGTWLLSDDKKTITVQDHKGTSHVYDVTLLTSDELQLSSVIQDSYVLKEVFSRLLNVDLENE